MTAQRRAQQEAHSRRITHLSCNRCRPRLRMTLDPARAARSTEYDETTYLFCSEHRAASFEKDLGKHAGASA